MEEFSVSVGTRVTISSVGKLALCELVGGTLTEISPVVFLFATYNTSLKTGETWPKLT